MKQFFFLQLSGVPASGKSTLAKEISKRISVIIVSHDVTKEALMGMDVSDDILSKASYCVDYAYADYYLSMGHNVILDSTCHSEWQLKKSIEVANRNKANYKYIECSLDDRDVIYRRLNTREYGKSQIDSLDNNDLSDWYESIKRPEGYYLRIDTSAPVKAYINTVMIYLEQKD